MGTFLRFLFPDLSSPEAPVGRGAPAGSVPGPARHVCVPALAATHPESGELIELCGGTVCKTVRQAGICIGKYSGRKPEGSRVLSEQWVLDSIMHLKQLSYDNYDLE
ncbi:Microcephalin [Dissostichus eleginoides]|uniref:Microcephalin n=1 Tax=Dissostichus eleginoides TaxID=100907 RepID=A0AAD9CQD3_DISEL|nr:Microcephalin [Dissostichus eleginoides]